MNTQERKRNYTGLGVALGAALGTVAAVLSGHVGIWLAVGIVLVMAIGASVGRNDCRECAEAHARHAEAHLRHQARNDGGFDGRAQL